MPTDSSDTVNRYIKSTNSHLNNLQANSPNPSTYGSNVENESPDTKQLIETFENFHLDDSNINNTKSDTINTEDCIPTPKATEKRIHSNKYLLNNDFNQRSPTTKYLEDVGNGEKNHPWMPEILRDQVWPDQYDDQSLSIDKEPVNDQVEINPLLSFGAGSSTLIQNNLTNAANQAEWRKYENSNANRDKMFQDQLKLNNVKLAPLNDSQLFVPDTFANKGNKNRNQSTDSFSPSSPLKLFGYTQNTYTTEKITNIIKHISEPKDEDEDKVINEIVKGSDDVFNGLINKNNMGLLSSSKNDSSLTYSDEYSNDDDDISQTDNINLINDGDQLFNNLKSKMGAGSSLLPNSIDSDYTSDGQDGSFNEGSDYENNDEFTTGSNDNSPTPSSINLDVTASLDLLKQQLNLNSAKKHDIRNNNHISTPKLVTKKTDRKINGLKFISGTDYKDKIYDKKLGKYVSIDEYNNNNDDDSSTKNNNSKNFINVLDDISDLNEQNEVKEKRKQEVSFMLPDEFSEEEGEDGYDEGEDGYNEGETTTNNLSYSQSNSQLVSAITTSYPEGDWNQIEYLDLSNNNLKNLKSLKSFTPSLVYLDLSNNEIHYINDIPLNINILKINNNLIDNLTNILKINNNLQDLELNFNSLENLNILRNLKNLNRLSLIGNKINTLNGLENFKILKCLNLSNNELQGTIDFNKYNLNSLIELNLDNNKLIKIKNLQVLQNLFYLSINNNYLETMQSSKPLTNLKKLSINLNNFKELGLGNFNQLRELSMNKNNELLELKGFTNLIKIEKVSIKSTTNESIINRFISKTLKSSSFNNLKKLNLSGCNPTSLTKIIKYKDPQYSNIIKLNLSAMNLIQLPKNFSNFFQLLTELNLNFNKLENLTALSNLKYLKQLYLLSNNLSTIGSIVDYTDSLRNSIKLIDLRVNPVSKNLYPYIFYNNTNSNEQSMMMADEGETIISLNEYEDIDAFSIEYSKLYEKQSMIDWTFKNRQFLDSNTNNYHIIESKEYYEMQLIVWFKNINYLDGLKINSNKRLEEKVKFNELKKQLGI